MDPSILPPINAGLNGLATLLLTAGFIFIRTKKVRPHIVCMISAFSVSVIFLITYVLHKALVRGVHTPFEGEGIWAWIYYPMLISHIILAIAVPPLAIMTLRLAAKGHRIGDFSKHRAWARWTWPIWYYVSITGVLVYFFLYEWFTAT